MGIIILGHLYINLNKLVNQKDEFITELKYSSTCRNWRMFFFFSRLHLVNTCYDTKLVREIAKHNIHKIPQIHEVDDLENNPKISVIMCDNNIFPS